LTQKTNPGRSMMALPRAAMPRLARCFDSSAWVALPPQAVRSSRTRAPTCSGVGSWPCDPGEKGNLLRAGITSSILPWGTLSLRMKSTAKSVERLSGVVADFGSWETIGTEDRWHTSIIGKAQAPLCSSAARAILASASPALPARSFVPLENH
jgi:hypothetical protein